jgi:uncharacterized membrane protein
MKAYVAIGLTVLAGAALVEVALVPAVVAGGAAVLAPRYVRKLRRRLAPTFDAMMNRAAPAAAPPSGRPRGPEAKPPAGAVAGLGIKQAIAKTVTFRIIVTTLDFTTNYLVIGELTTAAGLSTFNLIAGPIFYLAHETAWNYLGAAEDVGINLPASLTLRSDGNVGGVTMSRALAKTITFRTIATVMDFTTNYVVVGDVATAAGLSAFGFVLGPFVYWGHEKAWDYFSVPKDRPAGAPSRRALLPPPRRLLPAPRIV